jgi:hypothetical protein
MLHAMARGLREDQKKIRQVRPGEITAVLDRLSQFDPFP